MSHQYAARIVAVVVAYEREELLAEALQALVASDPPLAAVVVVDNASIDGTARVARDAGPLIDLVTLTRNTGGAGGFAAGIAWALEHHDPEWLWLMDDDTIPTPSAAAELVRAATSTRAVVAGSRVMWTDGSDHPMNTPRRKPFARSDERASAERAGGFPIRSTSFVSMLVRADAARAAGLPLADYFIWNDDFEYSTRLLRSGRGIFVPGSIVVHKTRVLGSTDVDPGPRFYYEVRNKIWMLRFSRGLRVIEKALYGASTVRRWLRTIRHSGDRAIIQDALRRGWRAGWRTAPRPNGVVLADLIVSEAVRRVEGESRS
jgi:GT2 family glycosyltransferase